MNNRSKVRISFISNEKVCCLCLSNNILPYDKNCQITQKDNNLKKGYTELGKMLSLILKLSNSTFTKYCCQICMDTVFKCFDALLEINVAASLTCQQYNVKDGASFICNQCDDIVISIDAFTQHVKGHLLDESQKNTFEECHEEEGNEIDYFEYQRKNCISNNNVVLNDLHNNGLADASQSSLLKDTGTLEDDQVNSFSNETDFNLCHECGKSYGTAHSLKIHLKRHDPQYKSSKRTSRTKGCHLCEKCGKSFSTNETLRVHREKHDTTCSICGKSMYKKYMKRHLLLHDRKLPRLLVERKNPNPKQVLTVPVHSPEFTPLQCDHCDKSYIDRHLLVNHIALMHGGRFEKGEKRGKRRGVECSLCGLVVLSNPKLKQHKREEHGVVTEDRIQCELCKRWYSGKMCLRTHIKYEHMKMKPYSCKLCQKLFKRHQGLWAHMRAHQDRRPYECGVCHVNYRQRYEVINHLVKHVRAGDIAVNEAFAKTLTQGNNQVGILYLKDQKVKQVSELSALLQ